MARKWFLNSSERLYDIAGLTSFSEFTMKLIVIQEKYTSYQNYVNDKRYTSKENNRINEQSLSSRNKALDNEVEDKDYRILNRKDISDFSIVSGQNVSSV